MSNLYNLLKTIIEKLNTAVKSVNGKTGDITLNASDVGADASGTAESKVSTHNTSTDSHSDIRLMISGLTNRLNTLADSDDATLDQLSEVVAYIKSNRDLISSITTSKVNVEDIIDNLTTNVADKPLSAAQGVALKELIDAISIPEVDETLSESGKAADAAAVGDRLSAFSNEISNLPQPDWNQNDSAAPDYVKNRPFYTGDPVETVLVEESTVTFADTGYGFYAAEFSSTFEATVGETYKVYWDGAAYECTCVKFNNGQAIGNLSVAGSGSDTGEPFLIGIVNDGRIEIATKNTSSSHTFSISGKVAPVVKIDKKYLVQPDLNQNDETAPDYVKNRPFYTGDPVETVLVEESTVSFTGGGSDPYIGELQSTMEATVGEIYKVSWDGTVYECVCADFNGYTAIGNFSILGAGSDTGEPFLIGIVNGQEIQIVTADTSASHTISISGMVAQIVKIDDKYLAISETIDLSSLSEWTGEQKQNLYDKFKSGKILLAKNIPDVEGLLTITYVNYDNMFSEFEINAIGGHYACKSYGSSWDIFELSNSNVQNRINNTLDSKTSWKLYSANATHVDIGEPFRIELQCIEGKPVFYFELRGNPGVKTEYKYPFLQKSTELEIGSSTGSSSKVFKITVDDNSSLKVVNTSDSSEVTMAKTSDVPTDDHINELINNAVPTVPTNVSAFTNDAGYLTLATLPKYEGVVE